MSGPDFEMEWGAPWWAWLLFAATILVYWLWGTIPLVRMVGVQMVGWGLWCIFAKQGIPFGVEGRPPSGYITGWGAILIGVISAIAGGYAIGFPVEVACLLDWEAGCPK